MSEARDRKTGLVIEPEDLLLLDRVDRDNYECPDENCRVKLSPCAFDKDSKVRPYFSAKVQEHNENCSYIHYEKLAKIGKRKQQSINGIFPVPYPSKLVQTRLKTQDDANLGSTDEINSIKNTKPKRTSNLKDSVKASNRVVTALTQIVDFFLKFPNDKQLPLKLFELDTTYQYGFKRIRFENDGSQYKGLRIYYGRLIMKSLVQEDEDFLVISLLEAEKWIKADGKNKNSSKKPVNQYKVYVDKRNITQHKLTRIKKELTFIRNQEVENFKNNSDSKKHPFIFFLAFPPNTNTLYRFEVIEGLLTCAFSDL